MSYTTAPKSPGMRPLMWVAVAAAALTISACSSDRKDMADAGPPPPPPPGGAADAPTGGLVLGGASPAGKIKSNNSFAAGKGTPDLNTVPTDVPKPPSSKEDRAKAIEGLIADRSNARYTDQGGRTLPVAVRPYVDVPEPKTDAVARLDTPAPQRPPEPVAEPLPLPNTVQADIGPQSPGAAPRRARGAGAGGEVDVAAGGALTSAALGGFRPLAEFQSAVYSKSTLAGTVAVQNGNLNANDRNVLNTTARQQIDSRGKGVIRVVGHGNGGLERAMIAAKELQRLGVAQNNLYVGVDNITGPTEVFFDRSK